MKRFHVAFCVGKMMRLVEARHPGHYAAGFRWGDLIHFIRQDYDITNDGDAVVLSAQDGDRISVPNEIIDGFLELMPNPEPHVDRWFGFIARKTSFNEMLRGIGLPPAFLDHTRWEDELEFDKRSE